MRHLARALLAVVATVAPTSAQDPEPVDVVALARAFRSASESAVDRARIADALLAEGERGAVPLFNAVRVELEARSKAFRRDLARYLRDFERQAPRVIARRLGRAGPTRVETLREDVLSRSRSADLSKDTIHGEIDPAMDELGRLLTLTPADVLGQVPKLDETAAALRTEAEEVIALFDYRERAETLLIRTDTGRRLVSPYPLSDDPRGYADEIVAGEERLAWLATPMSARDARVLTDNEAVAPTIEPGEAQGIVALNRIRVLVGLPALAIDVKLCAAARGHSEDMVRLGFFSHTSPVAGKETFGQRAALAGTSASAENIAAGQATGLGAIRAWWYSPGHHRNMMSGASRVGLGRHGDHWTQMFGG